MKYLICLGACLLLSLSACQNNPSDQKTAQTDEAADQVFVALVDAYFEEALPESPLWATILGDHRFDHKLSDYSETARAASLALTQKYLDKINQIDATALSTVNQVDLRIFKSNLEYQVFASEKLRTYSWNPMVYNPGNAIYPLLVREFAPLKERLMNIKARLEQVPRLVEQAKANLENPPKIYTETAIGQIRGTIGLVTGGLDVFLEKEPDLKEVLKPAQELAAAELEGFAKWMEEDLLPRSNGDFRLGDAKFREKLRYTLESDLSKEEILESALKDLAATKKAMYETALPMYGEWFPDQPSDEPATVIKAVLDKLAEDRPDNDTIVAYARKSADSCTEFVREKQLMTVPDEEVTIIVMPEFQRGVAIAYCDSPGPFEKDAQTFYSIAPTPQDWSEDRVTSFFREYNNYMVENLTVHEAMPGHYLQLWHANKFEAPTKIRAIFSSGTFTEGWAVYAEQLMAEQGYGGPQVKMQQLKMRLRVIINSIIDQKIHTEGMTEEAAMKMMMEEGFQEDGEAAGKWRRACLSSTQLSTYYVGNIEINRIRDAYEAKHGKPEVMKEMHDKMLSFGSPAGKYVRELMGL